MQFLRFLLWVGLLSLSACDGGSAPPGTDSGPLAMGETGRMIGMTAAHNRWRASIAATPAIPPVVWSAEIAAVAQAYSESLAAGGCSLTHSHGEYGENLAWFGGSMADPDRVVDLWASEGSCYTYGTFMGTDVCTSACASSGGCGHYTQVLWRETTHIGCGVATCPGGEEIWTCNYDPPGNYVGNVPY